MIDHVFIYIIIGCATLIVLILAIAIYYCVYDKQSSSHQAKRKAKYADNEDDSGPSGE